MEKSSEEIRKQISEKHQAVLKDLDNKQITVADALTLYLTALELMVNYDAMMDESELHFWYNIRIRVVSSMLAQETSLFDNYTEMVKHLSFVSSNQQDAKELRKSLEGAKSPEADEKKRILDEQIALMQDTIDFSAPAILAVSSIFCDYYGQNPTSAGYHNWSKIYNIAATASEELPRGYSHYDTYRMSLNELQYLADKLLKDIASSKNSQLQTSLAMFYKQITDVIAKRTSTSKDAPK